MIKIFNAQRRDEVETRVARVVYACEIPFNVILAYPLARIRDDD